MNDDSAFITDDEISNAYDSEEEDSALESYNKNEETLTERFFALKDILSPSTRSGISNTFFTTSSILKWSGNKIGQFGWIVMTSSLLVGLPLMLSIEGEAGLMAQEKEFNLQQATGNTVRLSLAV